MSDDSIEAKTAIIDSPGLLVSLLDTLTALPTDPPSLYIDFEGVELGRHGSISIISLYVAPRERIYLIDVHRLGKTAFSTMNSNNETSLKTILESPGIPKVIFDIRSDSDALFNLYGISVRGIKDLQLMELAAREGPREFVAGLAKCIEYESPIPMAEKSKWKLMREEAIQIYNPERGGRLGVFDERPIRPEILRYCAWDVSLLPELYNVYDTRLRLPGNGYWNSLMLEATSARIKRSQSPNYDGKTRARAFGPWKKEDIDRAIREWNDYDWEDDTACDCIGWEDDMIKNGEYF